MVHRSLYCRMFQSARVRSDVALIRAAVVNIGKLIFEKDRRINFTMKKIIALSSLLALIALGMACGGAATNNTTNVNRNVNAALSNANAALTNAANQVNAAANQVANAASQVNAATTNVNRPMANANANKPANK